MLVSPLLDETEIVSLLNPRLKEETAALRPIRWKVRIATSDKVIPQKF
jgi:hypothetical protein